MLRATARELSAAVAFLTIVAVPIRAQQQRAAEEPATDMQWAVKIPMRDGMKLNATIFYMAHSAFQSYVKLVGNPSAVFQNWLAHPVPDAYYDAMVPSPEQYKKISLPILTITGHYDGDQPGAFPYYNRPMQYGTAEAKAQHYLIIGPWDTRAPARQRGKSGD